MSILEQYGIPLIPLLYEDPFIQEKVEELASGPETLSGNAVHLREGIVIEKLDREKSKGPIKAKLVSKDYKLRKNGTEYR